MMTLHALVKDKDTNSRDIITRWDLKSKEAFWLELERNGYTVIRISNNRDLKAQSYYFVTFAAMKKYDKLHIKLYGTESEYHDIIEQINQIEL